MVERWERRRAALSGQKLADETVVAKVQMTVGPLAALSAAWMAVMMVGPKAGRLAALRVDSKVAWRVVMMVATTADR